jgi:hypothetical protein
VAEADASGVHDANLIADLIFYLDHLPLEQAFPPRPEEIPLAPGFRVTLRVWLPGMGEARPEEVVFGYLPNSQEVAVYFPGEGKLLQVPSQILTTLRNMFHALGAIR